MNDFIHLSFRPQQWVVVATSDAESLAWVAHLVSTGGARVAAISTFPRNNAIGETGPACQNTAGCDLLRLLNWLSKEENKMWGGLMALLFRSIAE